MEAHFFTSHKTQIHSRLDTTHIFYDYQRAATSLRGREGWS